MLEWLNQKCGEKHIYILLLEIYCLLYWVPAQKQRHSLSEKTDSPVTEFWTDRPGSADPLEWIVISWMVSRIDCETREDGHNIYHNYGLPCISICSMFCRI